MVRVSYSFFYPAINDSIIVINNSYEDRGLWLERSRDSGIIHY